MEPVKSLETARLKAVQLSHALQSFSNTLRSPGEDLPPWNILQSHFTVLSSHIKSLSEHLHRELPVLPPVDAKSKDKPNTLVAYPNANFPGQHSMIVETLISKRLIPEVKEELYEALCEDDVEDKELQDRYILAREWCQEEIGERNWKAHFTEEEIEAGMDFDDKTVKMLREKEVDEGKKKVESEMMKLEGMLRFITTGIPVEEQRPLPKAPMKKK